MQNQKTQKDDENAGNFAVIVRCRPQNHKEQDHSLNPIVFIEQNSIFVTAPEIAALNNPKKSKQYTFDQVYGQSVSTLDIYEQSISQITSAILDGYNSTVFSYGQTGSGKTFTMLGSYDQMGDNQPGIVFLIVENLFQQLEQLKSLYSKFRVKISYLEIYNEQIRDLMCDKNDNLMIIETSSKENSIYVQDLTEYEIFTSKDLMNFIKIGNKRRTMATTAVNAFSSRSHAIIQISVECTRGNQIILSKLSLIDLAGSERAANTENRGLRLLEGGNINKSLLALGTCIQMLSDQSKEGAYVPYRNSKLTRLLKDSLGGNTKTIMIACISPAKKCFDETINTLNYASLVKKIKRTVIKNLRETTATSSEYKGIIDNLKAEISILKSQVIEQAEEISSENFEMRDNIEEVSKKLFVNLEENFEIHQTLRELGELRAHNEKGLNEKHFNLSLVKNGTDEKISLIKDIDVLKRVMYNNEIIENEAKIALEKNVNEKESLIKNLASFNGDLAMHVSKLKCSLDMYKKKQQELMQENALIKKKAEELEMEKKAKDLEILQIKKQLENLKSTGCQKPPKCKQSFCMNPKSSVNDQMTRNRSSSKPSINSSNTSIDLKAKNFSPSTNLLNQQNYSRKNSLVQKNQNPIFLPSKLNSIEGPKYVPFNSKLKMSPLAESNNAKRQISNNDGSYQILIADLQSLHKENQNNNNTTNENLFANKNYFSNSFNTNLEKKNGIEHNSFTGDYLMQYQSLSTSVNETCLPISTHKEIASLEKARDKLRFFKSKLNFIYSNAKELNQNENKQKLDTFRVKLGDVKELLEEYKDKKYWIGEGEKEMINFLEKLVEKKCVSSNNDFNLSKAKVIKNIELNKRAKIQKGKFSKIHQQSANIYPSKHDKAGMN